MKKLFTLATLSIILVTSAFASGHKKEVTSLKATVHEVDGMYVLVPNSFNDHKLIPLGLPAEYEVEGLQVTVEGTISKCRNKHIDISISAIAVEQDVQKKLGLHHIEYNNRSYALSASRF
jgi:hypothetical protein